MEDKVKKTVDSILDLDGNELESAFHEINLLALSAMLGIGSKVLTDRLVDIHEKSMEKKH